MMVVAIGVTIFLLTYILPKFAPLFQSRGKSLPGPTRFMMATSDVLIDYWYLWLAGVVALVVGFIFRQTHRAGAASLGLGQDQPADRRPDVPQSDHQPQHPHAGHDGRQRRARCSKPSGCRPKSPATTTTSSSGCDVLDQVTAGKQICETLRRQSAVSAGARADDRRRAKRPASSTSCWNGSATTTIRKSRRRSKPPPA